MAERASCGYRSELGLWAPLTCGREKGHTGMHIDFRRATSIAFGRVPVTATAVATQEEPPSLDKS